MNFYGLESTKEQKGEINPFVFDSKNLAGVFDIVKKVMEFYTPLIKKKYG